MSQTELLYLKDMSVTTAEASVLAVAEENARTVVILDKTIFYPQGGGQPYDTGAIESPSGKFLVEEVRFADGVVNHIGKFERRNFSSGETVQCNVDKDRRALMSRLHSSGHVLDMAVRELRPTWVPGKGYHFSEGPYVEYVGSLEGVDAEELKRGIEALCNKFVTEGRETTIRFVEKSGLSTLCSFVPSYIPEGKPARVVLFGSFGVPCGGTHVANLKEIKSMTIRKIKVHGENVRVAYDGARA